MKSGIGWRRPYSAQLLHSSVARVLTCPRARSVYFDMLPAGRSADSSWLGRQAQYFETRYLSCAASSHRIRLGSPKDRPIGLA
jgi:hypothetical protein